MKQIFKGEAISMAPCNRGFVFAEIHKEEIDGVEKKVIAFHQHSFDTGITDPITKGGYLNNIFPNHGEFLREEIDDYINTITVFTPNLGIITIRPNGTAKVYDYNCKFKWKGSLKYKGYPPTDAVIHSDRLWCAYPDSDTLICYNANSMRQEFKISSGVSAEIREPFGLFVSGSSLIINSQNSGLVKKLNLKDYSVKKAFEFSESVKKYIKIDSNEIVMTKSGIYRI